jgi:aspartate/methionine/tyrosine aminotransferase
MPFQIFELERWQSDYEHSVEYNLADSSVRGALVADLVSAEDLENLRALDLAYPMVNGTDALRERIAALYRQASSANVLVTVGGAEANQIACQTLLGPGDRVVVMEPAYRQVHGLALSLGCEVSSFALEADRGWRPDLDALERGVDERTRLISVVNPNNPTGSILRPDEVTRLVSLASRVGAWILADEVYRGAERYTDEETPSFWGEYERTIAVGSLSKAYGLPGLRIGWLVAPASLVGPLWRRHEYAVIAAAAPSMRLAELALAEPRRSALLARQRRLSREGWTLLQEWLRAHDGLVSVGASEATSVALVRYHLPIDSVRLADDIRTSASVLVAPGAFLGAEGHMRLTHGLGRDRVAPALERIGGVLERLRARELAAPVVPR